MEENELGRLQSVEEEINEGLERILEEITQVSKQLEKPLPEPVTGFGHVIVIDNLPVVPESKMSKLEIVIKKTVNTVTAQGVIPGGVHLVYDDEKGKTKSFAFVELVDEDRVPTAVDSLNGYRLDKTHVLKATPYNKMEELTSIPEEFAEPDPQSYKPKENLRSWLLDPRRDQYAIYHGDSSEVYWNEPQRQPEPLYSRKQWTDSFLDWSPQGTYLVTLHPQGVQIWGGDKEWTSAGRFPHAGAALIQFSPCENFLMTFSPQFKEKDNPKDPKCIIVWDVRTGTKRRGFVSLPNAKWPEFRWSHDDNYFARMVPGDSLSVYETQTMGLLDKKSMKCTGIKDFLWSHTDNTISSWYPESGNGPARVVLTSIPSRKEIVSKALYNVNDCRMHWQGNGDYLCVKVDRHTKTKKKTYTSFELFRIRSKNVPVEILELKDEILAFAWEPKGDRFAIIHQPNPNQRPDVSFYEMRPEGGVRHLKTLEKRQANHLFWAPTGGFILLAGLRSADGGHLEFYNVNDLESMVADDHFGCSHIAWDPTGRFVATSVSEWANQKMENGYNIWSFQGKLIHKVLKDRFYQFLWRPRPPTLLSKEKEEFIRSHIKDYTRRFEKEEEEEGRKILQELEDKKNQVLRDFNAWRASLAARYEESREARRALWGGAASDEDDAWEFYSEEIEEIISEVVEEF